MKASVHSGTCARVNAARLLVALAILSGCNAAAPTSPGTSVAQPSASGSPTASVAPTPAMTGLTGHIVFTRAGKFYGDETVFVANIDGTDEMRLTEYGGGGGPWALPDGSRITFSIFPPGGRVTGVVSRLDGSQRVVLPLPPGTLNVGSGPISPDGALLVREAFDDAHPETSGIYVSSTTGADLRRVTQEHFIAGDFSPDGRQLVLFLGPDGSPPPAGALWTVNLDGSGLRQLTPLGVQVQCCFNYRWSPDGSKILFADVDGVLWTIAPDGSQLTQVFKDADGRWAITPTWSPDGSMILFGLDPIANPFAHPVNGFYVVRADGSGLTEVLGGDDFKREPVWVSG